LISEILRSFGSVKVFSNLELRAVYNQLRIRDEDVHNTVFVILFGNFESPVMLFGRANAPAEFQAFMNSVFREAFGDYVLGYIDDIIIYSVNVVDHELNFRSVYTIRSRKLFCNLQKCHFFLESVDYLGENFAASGSLCHPSIDSYC
jgi:hypothetical protein